MPNEQKALVFPPAYRASERWPSVLDLVRAVCVDLGRGEVVEALDVSPSHLKNALVERDRHELKARELLYFIAADRSGQLIRELADLAGCEVAPAEPMTPEEELRRLQSEVRRRFGPSAEMAIQEAKKR